MEPSEKLRDTLLLLAGLVVVLAALLRAKGQRPSKKQGDVMTDQQRYRPGEKLRSHSVGPAQCARFTKHIEAAYAAMFERHRNGLPPEHIAVPA